MFFFCGGCVYMYNFFFLFIYLTIDVDWVTQSETKLILFIVDGLFKVCGRKVNWFLDRFLNFCCLFGAHKFWVDNFFLNWSVKFKFLSLNDRYFVESTLTIFVSFAGPRIIICVFFEEKKITDIHTSNFGCAKFFRFLLIIIRRY